MLLTFTLTQLLDAMIFLGKIDQIKIGCERSRNGARVANTQRFDLSLKLFHRFNIASATVFRGKADALLGFKQDGGLKLRDDIAKDIAQ